LAAPDAYVEWMNGHPGFNPRAQQSSNALSDFVLADIRSASPAIEIALASGRVKKNKNANVNTKVVARNVDLIFQASEASTSSVLLAVENKTIMAAHGKARKNRLGDLIAYCNHMHNHRRDCIAAGVVVINISAMYKNPDPFAKDIVRAKFDMQKVVADTVKLFKSLPLRDSQNEPFDQPEALAVIIVDYDGVNPSRLVSNPPAPQSTDALCYDVFIRRIAELYAARFS
jgi:hypothetical protein